jgi:L-asparagine oxygenase
MELHEAERRRLRASIWQLHYPVSPNPCFEMFLIHSSRWFSQNAPPRIVEEIHKWKVNPNRSGALIIDGWGVDPELPPTPIDGRRSPLKLSSYSEQVACATAQMLGDPISFASERGGSLVTDLNPVKGKEKALTNEGSEAYLGWHTEHAATGYLLSTAKRLIDTLVFFQLRSDPQGNAKTLVADVRDALPLLGSDVIETLRRSEFTLRLPFLLSQSVPEDIRAFRSRPILTGDIDDPFINCALYGGLTEGETPEACEALKALEKALDAVQIQVPTMPGRLVVLDNRRVLHARWPYSPAFDGNDRWLQRAMTTTSLESLKGWQCQKSPRILTPGIHS